MVSSMRESGARGRTRRAILGAAASVLSRRRDATLADIAAAADAGRSTLQRYFPDREMLLSAVVEDSLGRGQAEGLLDTEVSVEWIEHVLWAHVCAGCMAVSGGTLPRHGASAWVIRTLENGIGARAT
ncbi:TetR family transcriptional regulator [Streptomyces violaceus]|uniref:TetR family transcriptional regulator n=1 Tax=Streptomyces violaceus TaxID=1936 RepID=UPI0037FF3419